MKINNNAREVFISAWHEGSGSVSIVMKITITPDNNDLVYTGLINVLPPKQPEQT